MDDQNLLMIRADIATGKATIRSLAALYMVAIANRRARGNFQDFSDINRAIMDYRRPQGTLQERAMSLEPVKKVAWELYDSAVALRRPSKRELSQCLTHPNTGLVRNHLKQEKNDAG